MRELIEYIAESLVEDPDQVQVTERQHRRGTVYELRVARADMGRVIGKGGRVANAMRQLLHAAAARAGTWAHLDIVD